MLVLHMPGQLFFPAVTSTTDLAHMFLLRGASFLSWAPWHMSHKPRLLCKYGLAVWARTKPALMFLLVLFQVPFLTVTLVTLVTLIFRLWVQMAALVDTQTIFVTCSVVTLITLESRVFHVLPSDVHFEGLSAVAHPLHMVQVLLPWQTQLSTAGALCILYSLQASISRAANNLTRL